MVMNKQLFCLYGSVTGKAQSIAEQLTEVATHKKYEISLHCLGDVGKKWQLEDASTIIIISSTTGEGEQPENVIKFWRRLRGKTLAPDLLAHINFAVLGLGDTNYNDFCAAPKALNRRLLELGAVQFYPPGWADDGTSLEMVVEPWLEGLWPALEKIINPGGSVAMDKDPDSVPNGGDNILAKLEDTIGSLSLGPTLTLPHRPQPYLRVTFQEKTDEAATVTDNATLPLPPLPSSAGPVLLSSISACRRLTHDQAVKQYYETSLVVEPQLSYEAGDTIAVICPNTDQDVKELCSFLGLEKEWALPCQVSLDPDTRKPKAKVPAWLPTNITTLDTIFRHFLDIRAVPKKPLIRCLVDYTTGQEDKHRLSQLCSKEGAQDYMSSVRDPGMTLLQLLATVPSCRPPVSLLLEQLSRLIPRPYSLSSSPSQDPSQISFVFSEVTQPRPGLATTWLINLPQASQVPIYPRTNNHFRPPADEDQSFIMVAAGSGLGPFLGFLRDRRSRGKVGGKCWLVFGCRSSTKDYIFKDELEEFLEEGVLDRLDVSFSRDSKEQDQPRYVQDIVKREAEDVTKWVVDQGAWVYVCGDANGMAKSVQKTMETVLTQEKGWEEEQGREFISKMFKDKRYLQDIWT